MLEFYVSIHAPRWGATARVRARQRNTVSIHAPRVGARPVLTSLFAMWFNSRAPVGRDPRMQDARIPLFVQLRAPGADRRMQDAGIPVPGFNHAPRVGANTMKLLV